MNPYKNRKLLAKARRKAKKYDKRLVLKPSTKKNKKLDAFIGDKRVSSFGDKRYKDFNITGDKERRKAYRLRHRKVMIRSSKFSPSKLAWNILW